MGHENGVSTILDKRQQRACLWLSAPADSYGPALESQQADLEQACSQLGWHVVKIYRLDGETLNPSSCRQLRAMFEDARRGDFDVLVVWSVDRMMKKEKRSVSRILVTLVEWNVRFYSYKEHFLDTGGPFVDFLMPLFEWLVHEESTYDMNRAVAPGLELTKGKAVSAR